jgi:hypothetical protein
MDGTVTDLRGELDAIHEGNGQPPPTESGDGFYDPAADDVGPPDADSPAPDPDPMPTASDDTGPTDSGDITVQGDGQLGWSVGGKRPTGSSLTLQGGKFQVAGQLSKGTTRMAVVGFRVRNVGFDDKADSKTGQIVDCERQHKGRITDVQLVPAGYRAAIVPDDAEIPGEL